MTIEEMKDYFSHRELGLQEAAGEYAILVPLVQWEGQRCLLFETRADTLVGHQPGEVCFPGGRREHGETPRETALRETWEEIGIPPEEIRVLAPLDLMQDISDRVVYPFLAEISAAASSTRIMGSASCWKKRFTSDGFGGSVSTLRPSRARRVAACSGVRPSGVLSSACRVSDGGCR